MTSGDLLAYAFLLLVIGIIAYGFYNLGYDRAKREILRSRFIRTPLIIIETTEKEEE